MGIQVTRTGTNWTVDVTTLDLVNDTAEQDFIVVINKVEQSLTAYVKTTATVITYNGAALPANTVIDFYRWGLRDVDPLEYGEVTSQLGMNRRLTQIERVLDDLREVKQFIWSGVDGTAAVATHVAQVDPHTQYRLKSADIPVTDLSGVLSDVQIPSLIARDTEVSAAVAAHEALANPHPGYTTAAQLTAALTGYLPTSQKGAVNGIAPLDGSSKIPAINSRGCSAVYTASTGVWLFTWADGATQSIDTPLELVFQSVNYNTTTKQVTFTLIGGATTSFSLADLVDLPEVQVATTVPSATPTAGQRLYFRSDTGDYWVSNGTAWAGPFLNITVGERAQLAGLTTALNGKQNADPTLQSIADSTATGLIQRNANEAVTLLPVGATGINSIAAGTQLEARGAIDAEQAFSPNAPVRTTLTGSGVERRASDGSVWQNGILIQTPNLTLQQLAAAGRSLVYNACMLPAILDRNGVLKAQNWSRFGVDQANRPGAGLYSLSTEGLFSSGYYYCDDLFDISPGVTYGVYISARIVGAVPVGAAFWPTLAMYSAAGVDVNTRNSEYKLGTASSLSRPLNTGATSVFVNKNATLTSVSKYTEAFTALAIYGSQGYLSPGGIQYEAPQSNSPLGFYTEWVYRIGAGTGGTVTDLGTEWRIDFAPGYSWGAASYPSGTLCGATDDSDGNSRWLAAGTPGSTGVSYPFPSDGRWVNLGPTVGTNHWRFNAGLRAGASRFRIGVYQPAAFNARYSIGIYEVL